MQQKADPMLLSLLEKIANPITELSLILTLKGVYAPSQQWKQSDESNPNVFGYSFEILGNSFIGGKIQPRKLTQKQLREQEQAKNKKGSKKQAKQEQKTQQIDPQAEKKRLQWEALSEEERFYRTQQDPYKAFSLLWADQKKELNLSGNSLYQFQDAVSSGLLKINLIRKPQGGEQQIAKLKKAKPKTLNLGQLYSAKYKGSLNLSSLNTPGSTSLIERVPLEFSGQLPAQCIKIECDKCYALIEISLSKPLNPLIQELKPTARELLGAAPEQALKNNYLGKLKQEIKKGMRAISQQYAVFFVKEKDHSNDQRKFNTSNNTNLLTVSTLRINQISKRKEQFLNQFASSGKYTILRDRIARIVKLIVIDRCRKEKGCGPINKQQIQRTLSELNVYLRQMVEKVLDQCVSAEAPTLHQDLVLGHEYSRNGRKQTLNGVSQSNQERQSRLAHQYEIINKIPQTQSKYLNLLVINNHSISSLENYARFCLRHGYYDKAYALYQKVVAHSNEFKYKFIICLFKTHRGRQSQAVQQALKLIQSDGSVDEKAIVHKLLSFLNERLGQQKKADKHLALSQKFYQIKSNPNIKINPPKNPYLQPTPRVPKPGKYVSQLSQQDSQQLNLAVLNYLIDYGFFELANDYLPQLPNSNRKKQITSLILISRRQFDQALDLIQSLLEKDQKNLDLLLLKAQICFKSQKLFECQEVYLYLLRLKPAPNQCFSIYLRLAETYLQRKSWQDAKVTFNKAVQLKPNSAAGWLGLGIANLRMNLLRQSEEAFNLSSIYNPISTEPLQYLQQIGVLTIKEQSEAYHYLSNNIT